MTRISPHRAPTRRGKMLLEQFLTPMDAIQRELLDAIHVSYQRVNQKRGVTPSTALSAGFVLWAFNRFLTQPTNPPISMIEMDGVFPSKFWSYRRSR